MRHGDLMWAAGFLEGEGSFRYNTSSPSLAAAQAQLQPLERLKSLFGGLIHPMKRYKPNHKPAWLWHLGGTDAAALMMTLFVEMSPRRREQITKALAPWRARRTLNWRRHLTHCKRGHAFTPENTYRAISSDGSPGRGCIECKRQNGKERERRLRYAMTHCKRGHELGPDNIVLFGPDKQWRACKQCWEIKRRLISLSHRRRRVA